MYTWLEKSNQVVQFYALKYMVRNYICVNQFQYSH